MIADSLSHDHHLSNAQLTHLIHHLATHQPDTPEFLHLAAPHRHRLQAYLMHGCRSGALPRLTPQRSSIASSKLGPNSWRPMDFVMSPIHSLQTTHQNNAFDSSEHSRMPSGRPSSVHIETLLWHQRHLVTPLHLYRRPLWRTTDLTLRQTYMERLTEFYASNSLLTDVPIQSLNINEER